MTTTIVTTSTTSGQYTETAGNTLVVSNGGIVSAATISTGGSEIVSSGGKDYAGNILAGGSATIFASGSATGDQVSGALIVSTGGIESSTTIFAGGVETVLSGGTASGDQIHGTFHIISTGANAVSNETVDSGGLLTISKAATVSNTTLISGGTVTLVTGAATLAGSLTFSGGSNTLYVSAVVNNNSDGDQAVISGFSSTDRIDVTSLGASPTLSFASSGGNEDVTLHAGVNSETFIFAGTTTYTSSTLDVVASGGHEYIEYSASGFASTTSVTNSTGSGAYTETAGNTLLVLNGGVVSAATISTGGSEIVSSGGKDYAANILAGGSATVFSSGSATGDQVSGTLGVSSGGIESAATVFAGGVATVFSGGTAAGDQIHGTFHVISTGANAVSNETVDSGGLLTVSKAATISNTTLVSGGTVALLTGAATLAGSLNFVGGSNTLYVSAVANNGDGDQAVISGFSSTDRIDVTSLGASPTLSFSSSGGNEVATVSAGANSEAFIFVGTSTYTSGTLGVVSSGGHEYVEYSASGFNTTTSVTTSTGSGAYTETTGNTLLVLNGGSVSAATIDGGAFLVVKGGNDYAATVSAGGSETISSGSATGDFVYGTATTVSAGGGGVTSVTVENSGTLTVSAGTTDSASTIIAGGSETVYGSATGDRIYGTQVAAATTVNSETVENSGTLLLGSGATASNTVLNGGATIDLTSPTATLAGGLTFSDGHNTLVIASPSSSGDGDQVVISGFTASDKIVISGIGANAALSFATSGGNEIATVSGTGGTEMFIFDGTSAYTSATLSLVSSGGVADLQTTFAASDFTIQPYNSATAGSVAAGPLAIYAVPVDEIAPTQINEGFAEVHSKAAAYDLFSNLTQVEGDLIGDIEPVVIGPGGQLYLLDGHHTFTALLDSVWGVDDPTVYVNVIANYSTDTEAQFIAQLEANNWLLPLNNGVPQTVNPNTGAPIPATLTGLTSDVYRGLEYSILKQKDSKLYTTTGNITGAVGASTPGLDKMPGLYSDFFEAAAYQDADNGLGLPYLSPADIALATDWNLNPDSTTTLPNVSGTVFAYQLPGFILSQNISFTQQISNATLGNSAPGAGSMQGAIDGNGTFTGITEINAGTTQNPIYIDTPNVGLIMQVGSDKGFAVTLNNDNNTYSGGTTFLAGRLIIADDGSLGAAPGDTIFQFYSSLTFDSTGFPTNVTTAVQADNGIIFNSLSEGNGTLTIGTNSGSQPAQYSSAAPFTTSRPIAVGNEAATIDVNGNYVELLGPLVTLGYDNLGLGETAGFPALTIDDLSSGGGSSATAGTLLLSTPSPYFYGNIIIGNTGTPILDVTSDAALGNTTGSAEEIGHVELNGGTLQTGASFAAPERDVDVIGGSQIDLDGNTTSWGTLTDVKRTIEIGNSSATTGAITFNNFVISQTSTLQLDGSANGVTYTGPETVTFTNGIDQTDAQDTLILNASSSSALGTTEQVFSSGDSTQLVDGIAPVWIVTNEGNSSGDGPYDFVTYGANGYVQENAGVATLSASTGSDVVELTAGFTASGSVAAYALNTNGFTITLGSNTLTIGDGTDDAGLILASGSAITGGTLAFGASQGIIWLSGSTATISADITGTGGLTFAGSGAVTISTAANVSGQVTLDSGTVTLSAADVFTSDVAGVELGDVKSHPAASTLDVTANNAFTTLNTVGTDAAINLSNGAALTLGDAVNNLSSTISSAIKETGTAVTGALTLDGSGLFDFSGGKSALNFVSGSSIVVNNSAQLRVVANDFANANFTVTLNGTSQLQFAQGGGDGVLANAVTGTGELHLIGGTLRLTSTANTYSGGTILETGSTLDITTANLPSVNENITDAGGLVVFDQSTTGNFTGVISDGQQLGSGPTLSGSLDKDDSSGSNSGNVTLTAAQAYSGATDVEAGTLTLGVANAVEASSGVTLGRVGGGATATLALGANNVLTSLSSNADNTTTVDLNGNTLTLDPTTSSTSDFAGTIADGSAKSSVIVDGSGTVTLAGVNTFTGGITIESGTLELGNANAAGSGAITFANDPTLEIDGTTMPTNPIDGFVAGDLIDLTSIANVAGSHVDMNYTTDELTITEGSNTLQLQFAGNFTGDYFHLAGDGTSGTLISEDQTACYCRGTMILTPTGEMPVEDLAIGDHVTTLSGEAKPVKWIGRRSYAGRFLAGNRDVLPIVIHADAFADGVPARKLWVSPEHALYLNGALVPARLLVNGLTIFQAEHVDRVEYFHIELARHDVIFADGAPAETFVDDDTRLMFHNAQEFFALYPEAARRLPAIYCAPRVEDGLPLEILRRELTVRARRSAAGFSETQANLRGHIDDVTRDRIVGWAFDPTSPSTAVPVVIFANGVEIGRIAADDYRRDLDAAGMGNGCHGFAFTVAGGLAPDVQLEIVVAFAADGSSLPGTPALLPPLATQIAA